MTSMILTILIYERSWPLYQARDRVRPDTPAAWLVFRHFSTLDLLFSFDHLRL